MIGSFDVSEDAGALATRVADWLIARVAATMAPVRVALSGGSTPKKLFSLLAAPDRAARMDWTKLHLFWGDERFVPYDSSDSNYGEAKRLLLDKVPLPGTHVNPFPDGPDPESAAAIYEATLRAQPTTDIAPLFEVNFLGLGEDGHTASLLPGNPVLNERTRWAVAVREGRPEVRLTLTYPALERANTVAFLVSGAGKAAILRKVRAGIADLPATNLHPRGEVIWFVDRAALGE
jgi:6-phosphogluconolactonase